MSNKFLAKIVPYNHSERLGALSIKFKKHVKHQEQNIKKKIRPLLLDESASGVFLGYKEVDNRNYCIGMPSESDGNLIVIGGNGSGKSQGVAIPTLQFWKGAMCITDIKGELSNQYAILYQQGIATRPYIIFDPTQLEGPSYDPFWWLLEDDKTNLISNLWELVLTIIPTIPDDSQPFWVETEQALLAAALLYFFKLGLSFSEAICEIMSEPTVSLCRKLSAAEDVQIKIFLGASEDLKADVLAAVDRGLRNKLVLFASDPWISHAFRGMRE